MNATVAENLLSTITNFYLESRDFNGIPITNLISTFKIPTDDLIKTLIPLIQQKVISAVFGDIHPNPHIRAFPDESIDSQIQKLSQSKLEYACIYPLHDHLKDVVSRAKYEGRPYTLSLALGTPQLIYKAFDLSVLEYYRNEPRYYYRNNDINGSISVHDDQSKSKRMAESDQVLLQSFGFCYNTHLDRAVAVYLRYLSDLTPEHQQIWKAKEIDGEYLLHPDYYRNTILGEWGEKISIFQAFTEELKIINKMSEKMKRPHLFLNEFADNDKPPEFSFLVRPTSKEYYNFVHLLDKMMSDNINRDFFLNEVPYEDEHTNKNGKVVVQQRGTIAILDDWIHRNFTPSDSSKAIEEMLQTFRDIRGKRQVPAHTINDNIFDQTFFHEQRELIIKAYSAIRLIRLILWNFPGCSDVEIQEVIQKGAIWTS